MAPIEVTSGDRARHRLPRGGDRQLNLALHTITLTRARIDPATRAYLTRRTAESKTTREPGDASNGSSPASSSGTPSTSPNHLTGHSSVTEEPRLPVRRQTRHACPRRTARGYGHIAFDVPDLDAAYHHAVARGARLVMPPCPSPEPDVRMAFVADPEGNLIELMHRPPPGE